MPKLARTDRMGALGKSQGRRFVVHPPTLEFARHYGVEIKACQAGDAKRKGKVERPFRDLKESFLQELVVTGVPDSIDELNHRGQVWVDDRVHNRRHRSTGVEPAKRFEVEAGFLSLSAGAVVRHSTTSRPAGSTGPCRSSPGPGSATRSHQRVWADRRSPHGC